MGHFAGSQAQLSYFFSSFHKWWVPTNKQENVKKFLRSIHRHPNLTPLQESHSLHPTLRGEALPWPQNRDCREETKASEESKRPSGDSWASSGTNRQAFATRQSHQSVLHWWQRSLFSRGAWLALKGAGSLGLRSFTVVKASRAFPLRQAFRTKEKALLQLFITSRIKVTCTWEALPLLITWLWGANEIFTPIT